MSKIMIFGVKDLVADCFMHPPLFSHNRATAEREFRNMVGNPGTTIHQNPKDYELYEIGSWTPDVGIILGFDFPVLVVRGETVRNLETN